MKINIQATIQNLLAWGVIIWAVGVEFDYKAALLAFGILLYLDNNLTWVMKRMQP